MFVRVVRTVLGIVLLLAGCSEDVGSARDSRARDEDGANADDDDDDSAPGAANGSGTGARRDAGATRLDASAGRGKGDARVATDAATSTQTGASDAATDTAVTPAPTPAVLDDSLRISWTRCDTSYECATLLVPVDYRDASSGTLSLALKRKVARGQRIGSLLINPGGPGGSGIDILADLLPGLSRLNERFDIIGFDPRGVGQSTPITCHSTLQKMIAADPTPDDDAEWQAVDRVSQTFADECAQKYPKILPHLGTQNVARDMDRIRAGLGEDKLNFLGFSYGTSIGAWYAELFPDRVRALVLDGAVSQLLLPVDMMLEQAKGFELALSNYFAWCANGATRCTWTQGKPAAEAFVALSARIEKAPLPAKGYDRPAGPGEFMLAVIMPLYGGEQGWQLLSLALQGAVRGDGGTLVELTDSYLERDENGEYSNITEVNNAVNCLDHAPSSYADVRAAAPRVQAEAPTFGVSTLSALLVCTHWGVAGVEPTPPKGEGAPPIVVIGTINDPATPYAWAQSLSSELSSGVLLTWEGEGHTAYTRGSTCIDQAVEAYFIDLTVPAEGKRCAAPALLQTSPLLVSATSVASARRPAPRALVRKATATR
jgi:pimeloyl-ACP methyl ester carboxylesterase